MLPHRHPLLNVRIEIKEGEPFFVSKDVPPIPLRVEARQSDDHWQGEAEKEINQLFSWSTGPLVRVVLLESPNACDVLLTFHHVIGDGMSGVYLMRDLLNLAGIISRGNTCEIESLPERPPVEELLPQSAHGVRGLVKTGALIVKQVTNIIIRRPRKLPLDGDPFSPDRRARIIHSMLSPEETEFLMDRCHKETATVHGALCAAILKASASQIYETLPDVSPITICCMSAVDIRGLLSPPIGEEVGFFMSLAITAHRIRRDAEFWDLARNIGKAVHQSARSGEPFVFLSLLDRLVSRDATPSDLIKMSSETYPAAILVTNLGHLEIPERYDPFTVKGFHFAIANKAVSEHFNAAIATYQNKLVINFSYTEPTLSHMRATALAEDVMKTLHSIICPE